MDIDRMQTEAEIGVGYWRNKERHRLDHVGECDLVPCLVCGRRFINPCKHVVASHGMTAKEYKLKFGIPISLGLTGHADHLRRRQQVTERYRRDPDALNEFIRKGREAEKRQVIYNGNHHQTTGIKKLREVNKRRHEEFLAAWDCKREEILAMWSRGESIIDILRVFGIQYYLLYRLARAWGFPKYARRSPRWVSNRNGSRGRGMTPRQQQFVNEYLIDGNATAAFLRCGFAAKGDQAARDAAFRMMRNGKVSEAIARALSKAVR